MQKLDGSSHTISLQHGVSCSSSFPTSKVGFYLEPPNGAQTQVRPRLVFQLVIGGPGFHEVVRCKSKNHFWGDSHMALTLTSSVGNGLGPFSRAYRLRRLLIRRSISLTRIPGGTYGQTLARWSPAAPNQRAKKGVCSQLLRGVPTIGFGFWGTVFGISQPGFIPLEGPGIDLEVLR